MNVQAFESHLSTLRKSASYSEYQRIRDGVLDALHEGEGDISDYWQEELAGMQYLLDASPLVVSTLRQHCYHVTGIHHYQYRSGTDQSRSEVARRLRALDSLGHGDLRVPEASAMGGFGHEIDGCKYNLDTLKYYESLIAMDGAGIITRLRAEPRPVVVEIGSGWGGLVYQMKTLVPHARFVLVDLPEVFILSGTYLATMFPTSRVEIFGASADDSDADILLVPHDRFGELELDRLDLAMNTVSFQEMTTGQVETYVRRLRELGADAIYSLNRQRSVYNRQLANVHEVLRKYFQLAECNPLPVAYNRLDRPPRDIREWLASRAGRRRNEYRHHVGRPPL